MNIQKACSLLDVSIKDIHTPILKKKYRKKCLRFHPDKHGDKEKFIELKEAYDFLLSQPKEASFLDEMDEGLLRQYLYSVYQSDFEIFKHPLFVRHFIEPIQEHLQSFKTYTLQPTLEQLFRQDVYYLEEEQLYIPLWHQEITFYGKIKVILIPKLPSNIEIDENNNVIVFGKANDILLGTISILITEQEKKEKRMKRKGIPIIQNSLYDASELSDILFMQ
jgi:DnaJ family protein A protein 2